MTIPISDITDTSASPPVVTVVPTEWHVLDADNRYLGMVCANRTARTSEADTFRALASRPGDQLDAERALDARFDSLAAAVAAVVEAHR